MLCLLVVVIDDDDDDVSAAAAALRDRVGMFVQLGQSGRSVLGVWQGAVNLRAGLSAEVLLWMCHTLTLHAT